MNTVVAFSFVFASIASAEVAPVSIGVLRTGMSLEELKAAVPGSTWTVNEFPAADPRDERTYRATNVMEFDGRAYDARIRSGWYGEYRLQLVRKAQERSEAACEKVFQHLLADLESRYGAFEATNLTYKKDWLMDGGKPTRTENHNAGKSSSYTRHETHAFVEVTSRHAHPSGELEAIGQYFIDSPLFGSSTCITSFTIGIKGQPPAFEEIDESQLKAVRMPSLGTLHNSLEGAVVPASGLRFKARCGLARNTGQVGNCEYDPKPSSELASALFWRKEEMAFDATGLSAGNPVPLYAQLEFRVDAKDRLNLGSPASSIAAEDVEWSKAPEVVAVRSLITSSINASPRDDKFDTGTALADCQVQADYSLACLKIEIALAEGVANDSYNVSRFLNRARTQLSERRAAPATKSGHPTRGIWVHFELPLKLRQDSLELMKERSRKFREEREKLRQSQESQ